MQQESVFHKNQRAELVSHALGDYIQVWAAEAARPSWTHTLVIAG